MHVLKVFFGIFMFVSACDGAAPMSQPMIKGVWNQGAPDEGILQELQKSNAIKGSVLKKKAIKPESSVSSNQTRILFIKTQEGSHDPLTYVVKITEDTGKDFDSEKNIVASQNVTHWKKILEDYNAAHPSAHFPELTDYYATQELTILGKKYYVTVMSKAKGDPLSDTRETLENDNVPHLSLEDGMTMATTIGQQMGDMACAFFINGGHTYLMHDDASANNFFYDEKRRQFSWIDFSRALTVPYPGTHNYKNYHGVEWYTISPIWNALFAKRDDRSLDDFLKQSPTQQAGMIRSHRLSFLMGQAFYNAYKDKVTELEDKVKNLKPANEWATHNDSFVKKIDEWTFGPSNLSMTSYQDKLLDKVQGRKNIILAPLTLDFQTHPFEEELNKIAQTHKQNVMQLLQKLTSLVPIYSKAAETLLRVITTGNLQTKSGMINFNISLQKSTPQEREILTKMIAKIAIINPRLSKALGTWVGSSVLASTHNHQKAVQWIYESCRWKQNSKDMQGGRFVFSKITLKDLQASSTLFSSMTSADFDGILGNLEKLYEAAEEELMKEPIP